MVETVDVIDSGMEYISPTFELYECTVCKKRYKVDMGCSMIRMPKLKILAHIATYGRIDGCCTAMSLKEIKDESIQD